MWSNNGILWTSLKSSNIYPSCPKATAPGVLPCKFLWPGPIKVQSNFGAYNTKQATPIIQQFALLTLPNNQLVLLLASQVWGSASPMLSALLIWPPEPLPPKGPTTIGKCCHELTSLSSSVSVVSLHTQCSNLNFFVINCGRSIKRIRKIWQIYEDYKLLLSEWQTSSRLLYRARENSGKGYHQNPVWSWW